MAKITAEGMRIGNFIVDDPFTPAQVAGAAGILNAPVHVSATQPIKPSWVQEAAEEQEIRNRYLNETQNMRVVALNEACNLLRDCNDTLPEPKLVMSYARVFAAFLIEGKT